MKAAEKVKLLQDELIRKHKEIDELQLQNAILMKTLIKNMEAKVDSLPFAIIKNKKI